MFAEFWPQTDYFTEHEKPTEPVHMSDIPTCLQTMVDILVLERKSLHLSGTANSAVGPGGTGVCLEYLLKNSVLQILVDVSEADVPLGLRGETIRTLTSMVELLSDQFLELGAVHAPVIKLLKVTVANRKQSEAYETELVDLMFALCVKIKGYPPLLNIFFHDNKFITNAQGRRLTSDLDVEQLPSRVTTEMSNGKQLNSQWEFLLWQYLLRFVHLQGKSGDLSRTGLLYLLELANGPVQDFILSSDSEFPIIVAAGLGALYSQLPRRVMILGSRLDSTLDRAPGDSIVDVTSPEYSNPKSAFLNLIDFCQEVLSRCPSPVIRSAVSEAVRDVFLNSVVRASMQEANINDGSAVAVCLYMEAILECLRPEEEGLSRILLDFVIGRSDETRDRAEDDDNGNKKFQLKTFLADKIRASSPAVAFTSIRLVKTIVSRHCTYGRHILDAKTCRKSDNDSSKPLTGLSLPNSTSTDCLADIKPEGDDQLSMHLHDAKSYLFLLTQIDSGLAGSQMTYGYDRYLADADLSITEHCISQGHYSAVSTDIRGTLPVAVVQNFPLTPLPSSPETHHSSSSPSALKPFLHMRFDSSDFPLASPVSQHFSTYTPLLSERGGFPLLQDFPLPDQTHTLILEDSLLQNLFTALEAFLDNPPEVNLEITGLLFVLAVCPCRGTDGWLTGSSSHKEDDVTITSDIFPAIHIRLARLVEQINDRIRLEGDGVTLNHEHFMQEIQETRHRLFACSTIVATLGSNDAKNTSDSILPLAAREGSVVSFLTPKKRESDSSALQSAEEKSIDADAQRAKSALLVNIVLLEEAIKEWIALIQVRKARSIGR